MKATDNKSLRGCTLLLAVSLSWLELPVIAALLTLFTVHNSLKNTSNPLKDLKSLSDDIGQQAIDLFRSEEQAVKYPANALKSLTSILPIEVKKQGASLSTEWLSDVLNNTNVIIAGDQGEGKSYLIRYFIYNFLKSNDFDFAKCRLYIHDLEDGLGHDGKFEWFGLPKNKVVFNSPESFIKILEAINESIDNPDFKPTLLVVDEFNNLLDEFESDEKVRIDKILKNIRNRGKKRKLFFVFSTQDMNVIDLGLSQAVMRKLDWIILPKLMQVKANFKNLSLSEENELRRAEVCKLYKQLDITSKIHPCMTYINKSIQLVRIPDLSDLPSTFDVESTVTVNEWWDEFSMNHSIKLEDYSSLRKLIEAINAILQAEGAKKISRVKSDEKYSHLSELMKGLAASHNGMPRVTAPSAKPNQQAKSQDSKPESSTEATSYQPYYEII